MKHAYQQVATRDDKNVIPAVFKRESREIKDWIPCPPIKDFEGRQARNDGGRDILR
jgi:hypothetical protein